MDQNLVRCLFSLRCKPQSRSGSCNFFHWIPAREREDFLPFSSSPADARSVVLSRNVDWNYANWEGPFVTEQIFSLQRPLPSLFSFSLPFLQGDFRLVDFYLNLICKKSPRVAIVIVVSLRARPLLNRRRKWRDGGQIILSHPRKLQKCRKWKLFMIHFALLQWLQRWQKMWL